MTIVLVGNLINGHKAVGPFKTEADAITWAMDHCDENWDVLPLDAQDTYNNADSTTD